MTLCDTIAQARLSGPQRDTEGLTILEFRFAASAPFFAGHFPGHPILPGVFQLEMARAAAEWTLDRPLAIRTVRKAKFTRPVLPDETLRVKLKLSEDGDDVLVQARFYAGDLSAGETQLRLGRP